MSDEGYRAILELRERIRRIEQLAKAAAPPPPADNPATFDDALRKLARDGLASGPGVDRLRAEMEGPRPTTTAPSRDQLAEAARVLAADLAGNQTIQGAYADMKRRGARLDAIENVQAGASGRVDPLDGPTSRAMDKLDKILKGQ
jgi:hypothetical protein